MTTLFAGVHFSQLPLQELTPGIRLIGQKLPLTPHRGSKYLRAANGLYCRRLLRKLRPAIYHPTYFDVIRSEKGTARVITIHDMIHEKFFGPYNHGSMQKERALSCADMVICVSESTRQDLLEYYPGLERRCVVIHHGVRKLLHPAHSTLLPEQPFILFVGNRRAYKNFQCLVDALTHLLQTGLPDLHLVCFGGEAWERSERDALAAAGLSNRVHTLSGDDSMLAGAYSRAAMMVYPSLYEGFGLPILEAMACGCPIITSNSSSLPEVAGEAAIYFDPNSAEELAEKIRILFGRETLASEMRERGYVRVEFFSWEKAAHATLDVYSKLVDSTSR